MDEVWNDIPGYEGWYQASSLGRVRSVDRRVGHRGGGKALRRGRVLEKGRIWSGYEKVCLSKNGKPTTHSVHRLICTTFHGPPPSRWHHAAHADGVRDNNVASNLSWKTPVENEGDKKRHGTARVGDAVSYESRPRGERHGGSKLTASQVIELRRVHKETGIGAHRLSRLLGVTKTNISHILSRKTWRHV